MKNVLRVTVPQGLPEVLPNKLQHTRLVECWCELRPACSANCLANVTGTGADQ